MTDSVNLMAATSKVERASKTKAEDGGRAEERWTFSAESGEKVELQVAFRRATPVKSHLVSHLRSALHPELTRTYTIDQAVDVVHSLSTPDRLDALRFKAKGPAFAALFDGTETLLAVSSIPWYAREISVP